MTNTLIALAYFLISVYNDDLAVQWHRAREREESFKAANISLIMGILAWIPYVLLFVSNNWQIVVADILGNWVGSYWSIERHKGKE